MTNLVAINLRFLTKKNSNISKVLSFVVMETRVFEGIKFFQEFRRGPWQEHFCEISSKSDKLFQRIRCLK